MAGGRRGWGGGEGAHAGARGLGLGGGGDDMQAREALSSPEGTQKGATAYAAQLPSLLEKAQRAENCIST